MGGSPKLAVDNIKELLNIKQKRNDYLGEPPPSPPICAVPVGSTRPTVRGSSILALFLARRQAVLFSIKAAKCHMEESGDKLPMVSFFIFFFKILFFPLSPKAPWYIGVYF